MNKTIKTSIYRQIASSITAAILDGRLKYNDKLPTEKELCEVFDISQTAVRMAYQTLINDRIIKRIKGKGTFVTNRAIYSVYFQDLFLYEKWLTDAADCEAVYLLFDVVVDDHAMNRILKLKADTKCYLIHRVIKKNGNPLIYQKIYLPAPFFPNFSLQDLTQMGLFRLLEQNQSHPLQFIHNTFSPIQASSSDARILNILPDEAIYLVRSQWIDNQMNTLAYIVHFFPGEFTEFEVTVHAKHESK